MSLIDELAKPVAAVRFGVVGVYVDEAARQLVIVYEDGTAVNLTYGIVRARYRNGYESPALLEPGETCEYTIRLNPVGVLLRPGQRLRLDVSSSDFPNFDRNHNTGADFWSDAELRTARQTVFHDQERPSRLILPVIPR